jgi:hypothetical protein
MSPPVVDKTQAVAERAGNVIAAQLQNVIEAGPNGLAQALAMCASMTAGVVDRAQDGPLAWQYFRSILDKAEQAQAAITAGLENGSITLEGLEALTRTKGRG